MDKIKLGFVPTRRSIFSAPDAIKYRGLTADRLREIGVDIVDIDDINDEGLLFDDSHIEPIVKKFRAEGVKINRLVAVKSGDFIAPIEDKEDDNEADILER